MIKIKWNSSVPPKREDLLAKISSFKVKCSKLQKFSEFFCTMVWWRCRRRQPLSRQLHWGTYYYVMYSPIASWDKSYRRTILLKHVDELVYKKDDDDIIFELQLKNSWITITNLFTFTNSAIIKVTCSTVAMATSAKESGLLLFNFFIPPRIIALDEYINLIMCYKQWWAALLQNVTVATCIKM